MTASAVSSRRLSDLPLEAGEALQGPPLRRALTVITAAWLFGAVWITATAGAPLTLFAKHLGATEFQFGVLSALPFLASLLSMPASVLIERTGERKRIFLWAFYIQRFLWVPIALAPLILISWFPDRRGGAMLLFLVLMFLMHAGQATGGPAWVSWMADIVPNRLRGRYFSRRRQLGLLPAIPAALAVGFLLDYFAPHGGGSAGEFATLKWCAIIFLVAALFGLMDIHLFQYVPDVRMKPRHHVPLRRIFSRPLRDRQFMWFAGFVGTMIFAISFMGQFVTLYLIEKLHVTSTQTQMMLLVAPMLGQLLVLHAWGKAVDRMGKKPVLVVASLGLVPVGFGWCFMDAHLAWLSYGLSAAGVMLWSGVEVANFNLVLEFCGSQGDPDRENGGGSSYVAINSVIINIAGCLGGLSAGLIAYGMRHWSWEIPGFKTITYFEVLFAISGALRLFAVLAFLPHIHEHGARPAREALRFMSANIYNNLSTAAMQPLRFLTARKQETYEDRR